MGLIAHRVYLDLHISKHISTFWWLRAHLHDTMDTTNIQEYQRKDQKMNK
jgi:hypothetical protein